MRSCAVWLMVAGYCAVVAGLHFAAGLVSVGLSKGVIVAAVFPAFFCVAFLFWLWAVQNDTRYANSDFGKTVLDWEKRRQEFVAALDRVDDNICAWKRK